MTDCDVCLDFVSLVMLWVSDLHVVCALKIFALLMRKALSPASKRTHLLNSAVSEADSFAQCFVAQDSLDSGGSVMLEELVGARMCRLSRENFVLPRISLASGTFIWKCMV